MLRDARSGITELEDLNEQGAPGSGWALTNTPAINDAGAIVGQGLVAGAYRPFLLIPKGR
jgi:hypothetical protein